MVSKDEKCSADSKNTGCLCGVLEAKPHDIYVFGVSTTFLILSDHFG